MQAAADPQAEMAADIVAWITAGGVRFQPQDIARIRIIGLALLPTMAGVVMMLGMALLSMPALASEHSSDHLDTAAAQHDDGAAKAIEKSCTPSLQQGDPSRSRPERVDVNNLPLPETIKNMIHTGRHPHNLERHKSRSEAVLAVLVAMAGEGCDDHTMTAIMLDSELPIGAHIRGQSNPSRYLEKQMAHSTVKCNG
jgi:hypothetical protein